LNAVFSLNEQGIQLNKPRAIVIGGSLGGLFAANILRDVCGWDVEVFERIEDDLAARGAGIATHEQMFDVLRRIGLTVDESFGVEVQERIVLDASGAIAYEVPMVRLMSSWVRFYRPLKGQLPAKNYHFGMTLERIEQDARSVTAIFTNGTRVQGDLLIGADGFRSTVRALSMSQAELKYAGYIGWRGMVEEAAMPETLRREIFRGHIYGLPEGEAITIYPVPGSNDDVREGHRRSNFVWYHPLDFDRGLTALCTDSTGHRHGTAIAPGLVRPEAIADMRAHARKVFAPQISALIEMTPQPFFQAIFDLESECVIDGRIALLGDAAFVARPHMGIGTTKAALDAQYLADALLATGNDVQAALPRYDMAVRRFGRRAVARARWLGAHLGAQVKPREQRTEHEMRHLPADVLMRELASRITDIPELAELV
jgi:2-polyprenyl-6-methoxyphenol hydroxylase-like FAD-dependent oxidoreductase